MMKRPLIYLAIAFATGILAGWLIHQVFFIILLFLMISFIAVCAARRKQDFSTSIFLWGLFLFAGYANYTVQYSYLLYSLQPFYEQQTLVSGYIQNSAITQNNRTTFHLFAETIKTQTFESSVNKVIRVSVTHASEQDFELGRYVEVTGVLRKPEGSRNPGGFDYANFLYAKKATGSMTINTGSIHVGEQSKNLLLLSFGRSIRSHIQSVLDKSLTDEKAALMTAMLTGTKENLAEPVKEAFRASGLMHIMAISGAHIAFLLFPLLWVFRRIGINRRIGAALALPILFMYVLATGMSASVLRASLMAVIILVGKMLDKKADLLNSLGIASLILLLVNPFMLFDTGFQLSVGATAGIGVLYKRIYGSITESVPAVIRKTLAGTAAAQAGVLPILIRCFSKISLVSILSNLLVIPLTGIAVILGMVTIILGSLHPLPGLWTGYILEGVLHVILWITDKLSLIPFAEINMAHWRIWWVAGYYILLLLIGYFGMALWVRYKNRVVSSLLVFGLVLLLGGVVPDRLKVVFIDVGQGDSALIRTPDGYSMLIDGGGSFNETETGYIGRQVLLPLMMHEGVRAIDKILVTHAHSDHMSGVLTLMDSIPVRNVGLPDYPGVSKDFSHLIMECRNRGIPISFYSSGDSIMLGKGTRFEVLYPVKEVPLQYNNLNNTSLTGMLEYKELKILFTGDMEQEAERVFIQKNPWADCDILKVSHHGSKRSTTEAFLMHTSPEVAVISAGRNHFGHPSQEVVSRLAIAGIKIYHTQQNGALIIKSNGVRYQVKPWLRQSPEPFSFTFLFVHDRLK